MKIIGYRTIKTGVGAAVAIMISKYLGLQYAVASGVITILSIENTKKQSVKLACRRIGACALGLLLSSFLFFLFGYHEMVFGLFLLLFIPLMVRLRLSEGITVGAVLVTHLLSEKSSSLFWIVNELALMLIGVGIALLLNLYIPSIESKIKEDQSIIEEKMKAILCHMAMTLKKRVVSIEEENMFYDLESFLQLSRNRAYNNLNNYFFASETYYVRYMEMRIKQFEIMKRMREYSQHFFITFEHTILIADFTEKVANSIEEKNTAKDLLIEWNLLKEQFRKMPLPKSREEFENRAALFQFLNEIKQFLEVKYEFFK